MTRDKASREKKVLDSYLKDKGLKSTRQRDIILREFIETEKHVSAEDLFSALHKKHPDIGLATVFRALKIFSDAGLAEPVELSDKTIRYEHKYEHGHHDHLICTICGKIVEFVDKRIEALQQAVCKDQGYSIDRHRLDIFGTCPDCSKKE